MKTRRLIILQVILLIGFGGALLLPHQGHSQPAAVTMQLPEFIDNWYGVPGQVTKAELQELAADTTFARSVYTNGPGDQVWASIVLAGDDPDNSLHRPERCLPAQGWTVMDSRVVTMKGPNFPNGELKATRLHSLRKFPDARGQLHTVYNLNYYWFIGVNDVTPSAVHRAVLDIRDRVVKGIDQRWAYVTVAAEIHQDRVFGRSEKETDELIQGFITKLYPTIVKPNVQVAANDR
jgi:EpsI family protein